ncbi:2-keto-4-pentenoate hydratase/2-oxohepta-3-ene-1,7-dioic acid hydratase in catechol pathway [Hasllibacter halocynthiae]|uniref:2-keto-4-pentenoate hydratase/2-oxohepta-3-ene-1,7-dioic acid hydratase in catechol pathway n=1 Tax=Hasllibacter halocynthiae TaxID=595589 RepID=A0A2T0X6Q6_9RHOB|nr:fumarylacetoacetate hydrolase family protein [Hasllibacter halocynthiae]PRY94607.1 2-keto-4-pentenoate hydratase/2-oxohepta-3-ene-1,7-dioic acid hydratase in catechol pathway [Hasllibacter halocynthiae]
MRLMRMGDPGAERVAVLHADGTVRDLSAHCAELAGDQLSPRGLDRLRAVDPGALPRVPDTVRTGPCVPRPGKIVCIGLNYADHAAETGSSIPDEPVVFLKAGTAHAGPFDRVRIPPHSTRTDWEVELGVVIGARAKDVAEADALAHVAGYCTANDLSERDDQKKRAGGQWALGKSHDGFAPMGPWLVTADEVPDPQALDLSLDVDDARRQTGSTATMIFPVAEVIAYLSRFMTLEAGDVILTGTPPGVGLGMDPPTFLSAGQVVAAEVEGLGRQGVRMI